MGVVRGNKGIMVTRIPKRKKPVLMVSEGNCMTLVATFKSEEDAKNFEETLEYIAFGPGTKLPNGI